ncbi:MAG: hypothetical protein ACI841_003611 [Planctomycetota bacterium]|jgi:hypothetical protein
MLDIFLLASPPWRGGQFGEQEADVCINSLFIMVYGYMPSVAGWRAWILDSNRPVMIPGNRIPIGASDSHHGSRSNGAC